LIWRQQLTTERERGREREREKDTHEGSAKMMKRNSLLVWRKETDGDLY